MWVRGERRLGRRARQTKLHRASRADPADLAASAPHQRAVTVVRLRTGRMSGVHFTARPHGSNFVQILRQLIADRNRLRDSGAVLPRWMEELNSREKFQSFRVKAWQR